MSNKYTITLEWQNDSFFEMKSKKDNDNAILIIRVEENQHYAANKASIESICKTFFDKTLKAVGDEMIV